MFNGQRWTKPHGWFARTKRVTSEDGTREEVFEVMACSRECIRRADAKAGECVPVVPL